MVTNVVYARFDCRTCGETVYTPVDEEQAVETSKKGGLELTCSSGHTDQYRREKIAFALSKPPINMRTRYARAAGG